MENHNVDSTQYVEGEALNRYSELKKQLAFENENFDFLVSHMPPTYKEINTYVKDYVRTLDQKDLHARADALIKIQNLNQHDELFEHMSQKNRGDFSHFRAQWYPIIWQSREKTSSKKISIGNKIVDSQDFSFYIAQTIEVQDSNRDPTTEYFDWIKIQENIEKDINTNGTTPCEVDRRNFFIDFMDMRETELKRIASLYSAAAFNPNSKIQTLAQEKLKFTLFKLSELRRLRDKTKATKSIPDRPKILHEVHNIPKEKICSKHSHTTYSEDIENNEHKTPQNQENSNFIGEQLIGGILVAGALNNHLSDNYNNTPPHTQTIMEVTEKINSLNLNAKNIHDILKAMRYGMSKEEFLSKQNAPNRSTTKYNTKTERYRGFDRSSYEKISQ